MRKIQTCVNLDDANLEWLQKNHPREASKILNDYLTSLRKESETGGAIAPPEVMIRMETKRAEEEKAIRAFFVNNSHIVYLAKAKNKRGKKELSFIAQELFYKDGIRASTEQIQIGLKEAMDRFDVATYEQAKGIKGRK